MKEKITRKTKIGEIIRKNTNAADLLMNAGMSCVGCPMSQMESLEEGCLAHGMEGKKIDKLVEELNKLK